MEIHRDETQVVNKHVKIDNVNGSQETTKLNPVLSKIMTPEDVHFPTSRTCEYVTFPGKGKLRLLIS